MQQEEEEEEEEERPGQQKRQSSLPPKKQQQSPHCLRRPQLPQLLPRARRLLNPLSSASFSLSCIFFPYIFAVIFLLEVEMLQHIW